MTRKQRTAVSKAFLDDDAIEDALCKARQAALVQEEWVLRLGALMQPALRSGTSAGTSAAGDEKPSDDSAAA